MVRTRTSKHRPVGQMPTIKGRFSSSGVIGHWAVFGRALGLGPAGTGIVRKAGRLALIGVFCGLRRKEGAVIPIVIMDRHLAPRTATGDPAQPGAALVPPKSTTAWPLIAALAADHCIGMLAFIYEKQQLWWKFR